MKSYDLLRHYVWLIDLILHKGPISLDQINEQWIKNGMSEGVEMSRHTFIRYRNALTETFGIDIECDRKTNQYYVQNPHVLRNDSIQRWMLSALSVSNIVSQSLSLQNHILLENIPVEEKSLRLIIDAMKQKRRISFQYQKYQDTEPTKRIISPCCIKLFRQRWYVIDYDPANAPTHFKPFAFDRIRDINITNQPFQLPAGFTAESIFTESFGIFIGDVNGAQPVVIRAFDNERKYIRDLPLHHSQEVVQESDTFTDYKYFIRPSHDFIAELLSRGNRIEVISPVSLREKVLEEHLKAARLYEK